MDRYILIFDDGEEGRELKDFLVARKIPVRLAQNVEEFTSAVTAGIPSAIVLDLMMAYPTTYDPETVGYGYITGARVIENAYDSLKDVPVILVSAVNEKTSHYRLAQNILSKFSCLVATYRKPLDPLRLEADLRKVLG